MNFLLDQDVYAITEKFLKNLGHNVITAREINYSQVSDVDLLHKAQELKRILVTRDRDYGSLVFVMNSGTGVIYLRISPSNIMDVHNQLERVITSYSEEDLQKSFVVVDRNKYRFRKLNF
jgi:predicted nuclease of predicted toxin-antitoxin system